MVLLFTKMGLGKTKNSILQHRLAAVYSHGRTRLGGEGPHSQFGSIAGPHFAKDPVQVFLDGSFREVQLVGNFLVELGFTDELDNLPLAKAERRIERLLDVLRGGAVRTDSFAALPTEFPSASKAVSQLLEFNDGRHEFEAPFQFTDLTLTASADTGAQRRRPPIEGWHCGLHMTYRRDHRKLQLGCNAPAFIAQIFPPGSV